MNKTTEPAALAGIEPVAWMHEKDGRYDVIHYKVKELLLRAEGPIHRPIGKAAHYTLPLYSTATVERLVQERNQWGAKLLREMADEYAQGAKDADKDSRVFLSEANARCAIHLRRKADELEEEKGNG